MAPSPSTPSTAAAAASRTGDAAAGCCAAGTSSSAVAAVAAAPCPCRELPPPPPPPDCCGGSSSSTGARAAAVVGSPPPPPRGLVAAAAADVPLCEFCVQRRLTRAQIRRRQLLRRRDAVASEARAFFLFDNDGDGDDNSSNSSSESTPSCSYYYRRLRDRRLVLAELKDESDQLRCRLRVLRERAAREALQAARGSVAVAASERERRQRQDSRNTSTDDDNDDASEIRVNNRYQQVLELRNELRRLDVAMKKAVLESTEASRSAAERIRFGYALEALHSHRIDVGRRGGQEEDEAKDDDGTGGGGNDGARGTTPTATSSSSRQRRRRRRRPSGIGKIGGLPLPHKGPELFGVLPPLELQSALRLVASATHVAARCLGILLPHPILLSSEEPGRQQPHYKDDDDIAADIVRVDFDAGINFSTAGGTVSSHRDASSSADNYPIMSGSTTSLATMILGQSTASLFSRATAAAFGGGGGGASRSSVPEQQQPSPTPPRRTVAASSASVSSSAAAPARRNKIVPPSTDAVAVRQRVRHARAAILCEDASRRTRYALTSLVVDSATKGRDSAGGGGGGNNDGEENFAIALQLLQNDVVGLCIRAGVPVDALWPAEALLLNLQALSNYCQEQQQGVDPP